MLVTAIEARPLRSLDRVRVELEPGIVSVVGPNGVGKTNLVEALYFALTGRSFRTSDRRDLIPFGGSLARAEATVRDEDGLERRLLASVSRSEGRRHLLDGSPADPATLARNRPPVAVFAPDRLSLVKGPPAERRAHLDGFVAARWPARTELRKRYGQALAQRNALLRRVAAGHGRRRRARRLGREPGRRRPRRSSRPATRRSPSWQPRSPPPPPSSASRAGQPQYAPRAAGSAEEIRAGLEQRREQDIRLGRSSWGPHLDELKLEAGGRSLRRYGSQGQQRAALLALLFAEREVLLEARRVIPLLLLDDVMSELDPGRRERLVAPPRRRRPGADHRRRRRVAAGAGADLGGADAARRPSRGSPPHEPPPRPPPGRATAIRAARDRAAPRTGLAAVQAAWAAAVGEQLAAVATPVSERAGTLTIECADAVWAQELDLMQAQLLERLREELGERAPQALRFRVSKDTSRRTLCTICREIF